MELTCCDLARPQPPSYEDLEARIKELSAANLALSTIATQTNLILESATDHAVITLNLGGRITSWNSGAERILGYPFAEALDRSAEILFTPEDRKAGVFIDELCRALDEGHAVNERWHLKRDGSRFWASGTMVPLQDGSGQVRGFLNILRDGTRSHAAGERAALLVTEMQHRANNTFAAVRALAMHTARHTGRGEAFHEPFAARIEALARSHELVSPSKTEEAFLSDLIWPCLKPYAGAPGRITVIGPKVKLPAKEAVGLGLAFHELATNAAKYGALSVSQGSVEVRWERSVAQNAAASLIDILWRERGGPLVMPPVRRGFGSRLIEHGLKQDLGGTQQLNFEPEGVTCLMRVRCSQIGSHGEQQQALHQIPG
ncbi:MAG: PAS domain S-box protein [Pseudomonas sp.]|nr:MAG: PAS domain S-box protein [Pseudomonas sp.]